MGEVVRHMEDDFGLLESMRRDNEVATFPANLVKDAVAKALDAFHTVLDGFTLADITGDPSGLGELLKTRSASGKVA